MSAPTIPFEKWQALGNDYLIVEAQNLPDVTWLTAERIRRICHHHFGVGADGILLLSRSGDRGVEARLQIFNPDGSEAELSGNGAREAILYLVRSGWTDKRTFSIETAAGEIRPTVTSERTCTVDMGRASLQSPDFPSGDAEGLGELESAGRTWAFQHVSIGNPQCVIEAGDEVEDLDLPAIGSVIEHGELFPNRTNVSFVRFDDETDRVRARIFERGVGETLSSGTGASGAAVAASLRGFDNPIVVELDGGELEVTVGDDLHVTLTGWADPVYAGEIAPEFLSALHEIG